MVHEKIISGKKVNVLSGKSPIYPASAEAIGGVKKEGADTPVAQVATEHVAEPVAESTVTEEPKTEIPVA